MLYGFSRQVTIIMPVGSRFICLTYQVQKTVCLIFIKISKMCISHLESNIKNIVDILQRLNSTEKPNLNPENRNAIIFDFSAIVRSKSKSNCLTFDDFANYIYRIIMLMSKNYQRCEIVADRCFEGSLKEGTRNNRGARGSKLIFNGESLMPKDFSSNFLANSENKENLNIFLAKKFVDFHKNSS